MIRKYLLLLALVSFSLPLFAQLKLTKRFQKALDQANLELATPTENSYRKIRLRRNTIFNCDFAMRQRRGDLEIRYALAQSDYPHISCSAVATNVASNEEPSTLVIHDISAEELTQRYHADWGAIVYFRPKEEFSGKTHGKLLALYREGKGMIYTFYLFDEITEELENQRYLLQFKK